MIKFQPIKPMIWTDKLEETIDYYVNTLGFICGEYNKKWNWASLYKDEAEIMIAAPNEHISFEKPIFTGSFYINVDQVDKLWNNLKDKCKICYELEEFPWGMREFAIYDNNGYLLQFGQDIISK
ncbi:MAG: hypothetical protein RI980_1237 [Bacteroidota bacterium]|jgi:uncharacterized glyoxalase superfamily protein PhnB